MNYEPVVFEIRELSDRTDRHTDRQTDTRANRDTSPKEGGGQSDNGNRLFTERAALGPVSGAADGVLVICAAAETDCRGV